MATWCDMLSYTAEYMADSIQQHGLKIEGRAGEVAFLKSPGCTIRFSNVDNEYVSFEFWDPAEPEDVYSFADFLDCMYDYRGLELSPNLPKTLPSEEQFIGCLRNYNRLLCAGYFDQPLSGNFDWVPKYHEMLEEAERLSIARMELEDEGHPEAITILDKEIAGDPTWMDDVRRILAEQETGKQPE